MDKQYKIVIIDDDELSADNLCMELKKYPALSVEGIARNAANGRKTIDKIRPDLLFLDVELPDMKGMELLDQLKGYITWNMQVVFYTAYDKYMVDAIRGAAFDYLLKPIDSSDLECIVTRFQKKMDERMSPITIPPQVYSAGEHTFMISTPTNDLRVLHPIDIGFFRYNSERKLWEVVLNNHQVPLLLRKNTTAKQITEFAPCFVQIHQSYIININYLIMIKESHCIMYPPFEHVTELMVSKKFRKVLQDSFYQL
ncbi:LytR/AlgR family response regulator transcription factor [Phocaeicola sp.]